MALPRLERIAEALEVPIGHPLVRSGWAGTDDDPLPDATIDTTQPDTAQPMVPAPVVVEVLEQMKSLVERVESLIDKSVVSETDSENPAPEPSHSQNLPGMPPSVPPTGGQD